MTALSTPASSIKGKQIFHRRGAGRLTSHNVRKEALVVRVDVQMRVDNHPVCLAPPL